MLINELVFPLKNVFHFSDVEFVLGKHLEYYPHAEGGSLALCSADQLQKCSEKEGPPSVFQKAHTIDLVF